MFAFAIVLQLFSSNVDFVKWMFAFAIVLTEPAVTSPFVYSWLTSTGITLVCFVNWSQSFSICFGFTLDVCAVNNLNWSDLASTVILSSHIIETIQKRTCESCFRKCGRRSDDCVWPQKIMIVSFFTHCFSAILLALMEWGGLLHAHSMSSVSACCVNSAGFSKRVCWF